MKQISPALLRLAKSTGRAIYRYDMFRPKEPVLIGVSGGKDSLLLSLVLSLRRRWVPDPNPLRAILVEWDEFSFAANYKNKLVSFFRDIDIPLTILSAPMATENCYRCARNRKRIIFEAARDRDIATVAFGHHMDDFVETTLINMATRGYIASMKPVQPFFDGAIRVVRPLCLVKENAITQMVNALDLPIGKISCPHKETNLRVGIKPIVKKLVHIDRNAREHIFKAGLEKTIRP